MHMATTMIFLATRLKTASSDRKSGHREMYDGDCGSLVVASSRFRRNRSQTPVKTSNPSDVGSGTG